MKTNMNTLTSLLLTGLLLAPLGALRAAERPAKPNIIFVLADDLGYGDVGVFFQNGRPNTKPKFATPHIDQMAAQGMLLTDHYTGSPVCAPARGSLLLGQTQGHCDIRNNQFDKALPDNHTLATVLKQAGYHTACIGKWGLQGGKRKDGKGDETHPPGHPLLHGFDEFFGFLSHFVGHHYYHDAHYPLHEGYKNTGDTYQNIYSTDLFTARAKKFISDHESAHPSQPFFLYLAYTAVHFKLEVPGEPYPAGAGNSGGMQWPLKPTPETRNTWIHPECSAKSWSPRMQRYATMV